MHASPTGSRHHARRLAGLGALLLLTCCSGKGGGGTATSPAGTTGGVATTASTSSGATTGPSSSTAGTPSGTTGSTPSSTTGTTAATTAATTATTGGEEEAVVRFVALGDGGEGNAEQAAVAAAMAAVCDAKADDRPGCDFALYLGDNFYDAGVDGVDDPQFQEKFEIPYSVDDFPFYVVLGNHDYGGCVDLSWIGLGEQCGAGWEFDKGQAQIDYTLVSDKWVMPDAYYAFTAGDVRFLALDTNAIMWDPWLGTMNGQDSWMAGELAASTETWRIAFGHHPYISNGQHGNAGAYEGLDWLEWLGYAVDVPLGTAVKDFFDTYVCGQVDLYISGHDHNRQWLAPTCGTSFIVSGAASKTGELVDRGNAAYFEDDAIEGFFWFEVRGRTMTVEAYDMDGQLQYSGTVVK